MTHTHKENPVLEKYIQLNAMKDVSHSSLIALPVIIIFESYMILNWFLRFPHNLSLGSAGYLTAYVGLVVLSVLFFLFFRHARKDYEKNYRKLLICQNIYALLIFFWALSITVLDAVTRDSFNIIVYVTIMTIVPVFCYIDPSGWGILQLLSAAVILTLAARYSEHATGFYINFSVLTIMSVISQISMYRIRRNAYIRQYELMLAREREYRQAHADELTGLLNRRSYSEKLEELKKDGLPENLLIVSLDVNGLKHVNDTFGHKAGDELLAGAAEVIQKSFSSLGEVYRVGGDEYMAILLADSSQTAAAKQAFRQNIQNWHGTCCQLLSISAGYAALAKHPQFSLEELEKYADDAMYEEKRLHHAGRDTFGGKCSEAGTTSSLFR